MKYLCLGYHDGSAWNAMTEKDRKALMEECFVYEDVLRESGHYIGGTAFHRSMMTTTTLLFESGGVSITAGPIAETKERLSGILLVSAADLNHVIHLMSRLPYRRLGGCLEIRPIDELSE
jgi:hypothetical protein